jgi:hypothetical protein
VHDLGKVHGAQTTRQGFLDLGCNVGLRTPSWEQVFVLAEVLSTAAPSAVLPDIPAPAVAPPDLAAASPALWLKGKAGWSDERFSSFCRLVIARPGPSTIEEDEQVAAAMLAEEGES